MQQTLVVQREGHGLDRPLEQQQESIGLVDFLAAVAAQQITRLAIQSMHEIGSTAIAELFGQCRAFDQIAGDHGP